MPDRTTTSAVPLLVERGRWPAFLTDLDRLATALGKDLPPVDYRARRQLCADPRRVLAAVRAARHLCAEPAPPAIREEMLARMFWATYTGGDLRLAPPPIGSTDGKLAAAAEHYLKGCVPPPRRCCSRRRPSWRPAARWAAPAR